MFLRIEKGQKWLYFAMIRNAYKLYVFLPMRF